MVRSRCPEKKSLFANFIFARRSMPEAERWRVLNVWITVLETELTILFQIGLLACPDFECSLYLIDPN